MNWKCHYGHYKAETDSLTYVVTKQWRNGDQMWFALMQHTEDEPPKEVPGPLPLTRRQAKINCEEHAKECANE